jgi:hypothetical protein
MQNVPQFVLKRLKEDKPADSHPDADLLTAFAEQSLSGDERARVMQHLSLCGDCRDVVAIALPATEAAALPAYAAPARSGWLTWPALRWGVVAAGVAAVVSLGILQLSHRNQENMVALNRVQMTEPVVASPTASSTQPSVPPVVAKKQGSVEDRSQKLSMGKVAADAKNIQPAFGVTNGNARPAANGVGSGGGIGGGVFHSPQSAPASAQASTTEARQPTKPGAMTEMVEVQSAAAAVNADTPPPDAKQTAQDQVAQNQAPLPLNGRNSSNLNSLDVVKAKDPVAGQSMSSVGPAPQLATPGPLQTTPQLMLRASARWMVSPSGILQRSFDGGTTWENINPSSNSNSAGARLAKADAPPASNSAVPSPLFRAVAASGAEVWAGGTAGALYHSSDGGNRWIRVVPATSGTPLAGDITAIQFSDAQHGKITTSTNQLWMTSDAGQSWLKQQ